MWTLIGRTAMNMFQPENSDFFMKAFVNLPTRSFGFGNPSPRNFYCRRSSALCGVVFLSGTFLLMPYLLGYSVMGMLSFPLEGEVAASLYAIFNR